MSFNLQLSDNAAEIVARLSTFTPRLQQGIAQAMDRENQLTIRHAQVNYLRGPRPAKLGVVTSRLRSSLNATPARVSADRIASTIGTNVAYAGIHDRGYTGPVQVKAHRRTSTITRTTTGSAAAIFDLRTGRIKRPKVQRLTLRGAEHAVRAHTRKVTMPARPYLSTSLRDRTDDYGRAVSLAVTDTWNA